MESLCLFRDGPRGRETWEITWSRGEVEVWHQVGDDEETERHGFTSDAAVDAFVRQSVAVRRQEGFGEGGTSPPDPSTRGDALWRAVREDPTNVGHRLVLGDWLTSVGSPQGPFILAGHRGDRRSIAQHERFAEHFSVALFGSVDDWNRQVQWRGGFLTDLRVLATPDYLSLSQVLAEVLSHPVASMIETLGIQIEGIEPWDEVLASIAATGPHPALTRLMLDAGQYARAGDEGQQTVNMASLWPSLPRLRVLEIRGPRRPLDRLPETVGVLSLTGDAPEAGNGELEGGRLHSLVIEADPDETRRILGLEAARGVEHLGIRGYFSIRTIDGIGTCPTITHLDLGERIFRATGVEALIAALQTESWPRLVEVSGQFDSTGVVRLEGSGWRVVAPYTNWSGIFDEDDEESYPRRDALDDAEPWCHEETDWWDDQDQPLSHPVHLGGPLDEDLPYVPYVDDPHDDGET